MHGRVRRATACPPVSSLLRGPLPQVAGAKGVRGLRLRGREAGRREHGQVHQGAVLATSRGAARGGAAEARGGRRRASWEGGAQN
uniref:Uncharacterized protein n=1 Tax=Siphoviridae sp. ctqBc4 TaxID=2827945 RepID=A0A8S5SCP5_9CAUD|nr:MAG TPA: hypothetical protein [Siphoviridae sp. ctqBc4]